jgi:proteic killer suppression protein
MSALIWDMQGDFPSVPMAECSGLPRRVRLDPARLASRIVSRIVTRYTGGVIVSFRHKGLESLYRNGSKKGVQAAHVPKLLRILSALDVAQAPEDLAIPSFRTHPLKGDLAGYWSIWVNGNWRVTFRFVDDDIELVDYQDYH